MDIVRFNDTGILEKLRTMMEQRTLVPVFGSGFTKGSPTKNGGSVPDGETLRKQMIDILDHHNPGGRKRLEPMKFTEIAEYFLDPKRVPTAVVKEVLKTRLY